MSQGSLAPITSWKVMDHRPPNFPQLPLGLGRWQGPVGDCIPPLPIQATHGPSNGARHLGT